MPQRYELYMIYPNMYGKYYRNLTFIYIIIQKQRDSILKCVSLFWLSKPITSNHYLSSFSSSITTLPIKGRFAGCFFISSIALSTSPSYFWSIRLQYIISSEVALRTALIDSIVIGLSFDSTDSTFSEFSSGISVYSYPQ